MFGDGCNNKKNANKKPFLHFKDYIVYSIF